MIKDIVSNEEIKTFFRNELKAGKKSGTYLFYGSDTDQLMEFALYFTKGLCCETLEGDFCNTCSTCRKIDKLIYSDLEVLDDPSGIKVDAVRELAYKSSSSSYDGGRKIFILKDIQKILKLNYRNRNFRMKRSFLWHHLSASFLPSSPLCRLLS